MKPTALIISFFIFGANLAWSAPQCKRLFDGKVLSDQTPANARSDSNLFVSIIYDVTKDLSSIPFEDIYSINSYNFPYRLAIQAATEKLRAKELTFAHFADKKFVLDEGGSTILRQKIRIFVENSLADAQMIDRGPLNFRFFAKLVQLGGYSEAEVKIILQNFLNAKLKTLNIQRKDIIIPLILEQILNPAAPPFLKAIQNTEKDILLVTNSRSIQFGPTTLGKTQFDDLGIDYYTIRKSAITDFTNHEITQDGAGYRIEVSATAGKPFDLFAPKQKPNLAEMWKDNQLQGVVLIDQEFTEDGNWLIEEYKDYYTAEGFEFSRSRSMDIKEAFVTPFTDGKLDYFVAEHSGDVNLLSKVQVLTGSRQTQKGVEKIQIIYNTEKQYENSKIAPYVFDVETELPRLLTLREKNKIDTELIFVNGKCRSACDLHDVATVIDSAHLTYIGPFSLAETFTDDSTSPLRALITGIRAGTPYASLEAKLKRVQEKNFKSDTERTVKETDNDFRLPHLKPGERSGITWGEHNRRNYKVQLFDSSNNELPIEFTPLYQDQP